MPSDALIALSSACLAIAVSGMVTAVRQPAARELRIRLVILLGVFAALTALPLIAAFAPGAYPLALPLGLPLLLIVSPAVHFFVTTRTGAADPARLWRHAILPIAGLSVAAGTWTLSATARTTLFVEGELPPGAVPLLLVLATFVLVLAWSAVSLGYLVAVLRRLHAYRARLKDLFSNTHGRELRWLDIFMALLAFVWIAAAITVLGDNLGQGVWISGEMILGLTALMLVVLVAFAMPPAQAAEQVPQAPRKYAKSAVSPERATRLAARIETAMQGDRLYLDPDLSLDGLSRQLRAIPNHVSQTLNQQLGASFFDYVARWRIADAKQRLLESDDSVLTIAFDVGFNSRSTFYKAFRRETGHTPVEFRAMNGKS